MEGNVIAKIASVVDIDDDTGQGRILVHLIPDDNAVKENINWCVPLLPRVFGLTPKVGEKVVVMIIDGQRYYIGPIYGQLSNLDDASGADATAGLQGSASNPGENPENMRDEALVLPEIDDVSINGKGNSGIYVKKDKIVIHSGIKLIGGKNKIRRNKKGNSAAIQISYDDEANPKSSVTLFADKINLFGNADSAMITSPLHNNGAFGVSNEDLFQLIKSAQSVPYGERLCNVLLKIIAAIMNHTHPISNLPPCNSGDVKNISKYVTLKKGSGNKNLNIKDQYQADENNSLLAEEILSPNVKIN
jgi:hypothetical protein